MRVLVAIDLNDDDLTAAYGVSLLETSIDWDDLAASVVARADEFYCGPRDNPVRGRVVSIGDVTGHAFGDMLDCAEIGVEGLISNDADRGAHVLGTLIEMEQMFEDRG